MEVHRTCEEPDETELTPMGVKLNTRIHDTYATEFQTSDS